MFQVFLLHTRTPIPSKLPSYCHRTATILHSDSGQSNKLFTISRQRKRGNELLVIPAKKSHPATVFKTSENPDYPPIPSQVRLRRLNPHKQLLGESWRSVQIAPCWWCKSAGRNWQELCIDQAWGGAERTTDGAR